MQPDYRVDQAKHQPKSGLGDELTYVPEAEQQNLQVRSRRTDLSELLPYLKLFWSKKKKKAREKMGHGVIGHVKVWNLECRGKENK